MQLSLSCLPSLFVTKYFFARLFMCSEGEARKIEGEDVWESGLKKFARPPVPKYNLMHVPLCPALSDCQSSKSEENKIGVFSTFSENL